MSVTDGTTQRMPLKSGSGSEAARWRCRQTAHRIAADCERLLDELLQSNATSLRDTLSRTLIAARQLTAMTASGDADAPLFDGAGRPTGRLQQAHERLRDSLALDPSLMPGSPLEELALATLSEMRDAAAGMFTPHAAPARQVEAAGTGAARVLIVDDEPMMVALLQRAVKAMGHETVTASSARDALALLAHAQPDLVLTDIEMPGMSGIELLIAIKSQDATRHIPVIVISSADDMDHVTQCISAGAEDHIAKPFQHELLRARVSASIERKRFHDQDVSQRVALGKLIDAAEAVERDAYSSESIAAVTSREDGVGRLARVFDHMVANLKRREERLRERLRHLRQEVSTSGPVYRPMDTSEESPFSIGDVIADRYVIRGQLGQGGMGTVYHANDAELGQDVAMKTVRLDLLKLDPDIVSRLKSEILLTRKISHPNVVRSHDIGQSGGHYFITMELVEGLTIGELLDQRGILSIESTLAIATQLCDALAVAHEANVIHRDIKPGNLLVDDAGLLKVMDFGIARSLASETESAQTAQGHVIGTPRYMAPELLMGQKATIQSDLYAVGAVLYECLTGRTPYWADSLADLVGEIYKGTARPLEIGVPTIPPELARLIHKQLAYDPARRSASARELGDKLAAIEIQTEPGRRMAR